MGRTGRKHPLPKAEGSFWLTPGGLPRSSVVPELAPSVACGEWYPLIQVEFKSRLAHSPLSGQPIKSKIS